ncbi:hypothetical protein OAF42_04405 [Planctomicrobium sp.]|jgi:hypothetical protein|nr:hypothetical protein [Planctomicrobium sp.]MDA7527560.1 hypothetical protein [bacterium]MDB4733668.1 hypothetical protein [Planctomicrobium sp.]
MENSSFDSLEQVAPQQDASALLTQLVKQVEEQKEYHKLFDAKMLQKKQELGLPLSRPSSLQDVPEEHRKEVEATYVETAREVGEKFIEQGDLASAWMYLQVIREPEKLAAALDELPDQIEDYEKMEEILQLAMYQGVNPPKGVKIMLNGHGTCSTITALDQALPQMSSEHRTACSKLMVKSLYKDLVEAVKRHVEQKVPMIEPGASLKELLTGRDWIFEGGNYHVDVSHLNSVVRFARSIEAPAEELDLARQLALYGSKLEKSLQYEGEPPFEDPYPAHLHFFNILLDKNREEGLQYFRDKLEAEPDEQDKPLLAYVLVDVLMRSDQLDEAVDVSAKYLSNLNEEVSISFDELCVKAGRLDVLKRVRKEQDDLVGYAAALLRESK